VGIDETAAYLHGFSAAELEREATRDKPMIWIPILGRGQLTQLERIYEFVVPGEICPLLPSPATDPREPDDLMFFEYLDQLRVEPRNVIYASEGNPFEVYRQIVRCVLQYKRALASLGGCRAALSAMSSKLASLGALLARTSFDISLVRSGLRSVSRRAFTCTDPHGCRCVSKPGDRELAIAFGVR